MSIPDPELDVAGAAMVAEGARFVVIGGFAVIANRFVRATEDIDFLVPDDEENDRRVLAALLRLSGVRHRDSEPLRLEHLIGQTHLRAITDAGVIDVLRGGLPPLDYDTVAAEARTADYGGVRFLVAGPAQHRRLQAPQRPPPRPQRPARPRRDPRRAPRRRDPRPRQLSPIEASSDRMSGCA